MNSDSSCPICFEALSDKIKASPDNCDHIFCLTCLEKWSKLGSYCPVDRKRFKKILNLDADSVIKVKSKKRKRKRVVYDFSTHCEICSGTTDSNVMLLCDCCDLGYHIHCLKPPLKEVPSGIWFCPTCVSVEEKLKKKNGITKEVEAELGGFDSKLLHKNEIKEKIASCAEDSVPSSSCVRKPAKGTSKNLMQFSVFQRIEGIDASQEICSQISSDVPLSLNVHLQNCSVCNDEFFGRSQMQCKVCKLKYFKIKESKKFSKCVKNLKKRLGYKEYENIDLNRLRFDCRIMETQKNLNRSSSVLERRKRSLMHKLKKIHDSKCINTVLMN